VERHTILAFFLIVFGGIIAVAGTVGAIRELA
jgi:hypothetical protein